MFFRKCASIGILFLILPAAVFGAQITLKNGKVVEGKIEEETEQSIKLYRQELQMALTYFKDQIESIDRTDKPDQSFPEKTDALYKPVEDDPNADVMKSLAWQIVGEDIERFQSEMFRLYNMDIDDLRDELRHVPAVSAGYMACQIGHARMDEGAPHKALEYYALSLEIIQQSGVDMQVPEGGVNYFMAQAARDLDMIPEAIQYSERSLAILRNLEGEAGHYYEVINFLGDIYFGIGNKSKAKEYYQESLAYFEQQPDADYEVALSRLNMGFANYTTGGGFEETMALLKQAADYFESTDSFYRVVEAKKMMGNMNMREHRYDEARTFFDESLLLAQEVDDGLEVANNNYNIGMLLQLQDKNTEAIEFFSKAIIQYTREGSVYGLGLSQYGFGLCQYNLNKFSEAVMYFKQSVAAFKETKAFGRLGKTYQYLGYAFRKQRDFEQAKINLQKSIENFRKANDMEGVEQAQKAIERIERMKHENDITYEYYESGELYKKYRYVNGKEEGPSETYYKNGQLKVKGEFVNGEWEGELREYDEEGNLTWVKQYKNGNMIDTAKKYFPSGKLKGSYPMVEGLTQGMAIEYYESGEAHYEMPYVDNKKNGTVKGYDKKGNVTNVWTYKDGKKNGKHERFDASGKLMSIRIYKDDEVVSEQKL